MDGDLDLACHCACAQALRDARDELRRKDRDLRVAAEMGASLVDDVEARGRRIEELETCEASWKDRSEEACRMLEEERTRSRHLQELLATTKQDAQESAMRARDEQDQHSRLLERERNRVVVLQQRVQEMQRQLDEAREEVEGLKVNVRDAANEAAHELDQLHAINASLRRKIETGPKSQARPPTPIPPSPHSRLTEAEQLNLSSLQTSAPFDDADANREFFLLTALGVKLNLHRSLRLYLEFDSEALYQVAVKEKVPFYSFQEWILAAVDPYQRKSEIKLPVTFHLLADPKKPERAHYASMTKKLRPKHKDVQSPGASKSRQATSLATILGWADDFCEQCGTQK